MVLCFQFKGSITVFTFTFEQFNRLYLWFTKKKDHLSYILRTYEDLKTTLMYKYC